MTSVENFILSKDEKTFQYDKDLFTLPVPDLSHTLKKYLESVRPLVDDDEYKQTEFLVQQFATGEGKYLQRKLEEKGKAERNWLETWWEDVAYLECRVAAPLMNMAGPAPYHDDVWPAEEGSQIQRSALALYYTLKFWQFIRREIYKPMKDGKGRPMCMYQFKRIFNTINVPGVHMDKLIHYFKTASEGPCPSHIVVISKGHIFIVNPFDENEELLTPPELEMQFQKVRDRSCAMGPSDGLPYLTSMERTTWAQVRNYLISLNPKNYENLEKIQSSICGVWLEDGRPIPGDTSDLAQKSLLGCGENRWYDKALSCGIYENGLCISNADHTPAEGIMLVYVTSYIHMKLRECGGKWEGSRETRKLADPEPLKFVIDDYVRSQTEIAKRGHADLEKSATAVVRVYSKYGKGFCKEKRARPDAYCQLAMQLAYYSVYGRMAPTYETAPIKQFYHGRTETMRTCTNEAKAWCKAMLDQTVSNSEKHRLYLTALEKHVHDFTEACEFKACDRHLLGLYLVAREEGRDIPMIFGDPSFVKSGGGGNYLLSTSCIGFSTVLGAVLPMCENCIGTFYRINDDMLTFYITTWNADKTTNSVEFADAICRALDLMKNLLEGQWQTARL